MESYSAKQFVPSKLNTFRLPSAYKKQRRFAQINNRPQTCGATPGFVKAIIEKLSNRKSLTILDSTGFSLSHKKLSTNQNNSTLQPNQLTGYKPSIYKRSCMNLQNKHSQQIPIKNFVPFKINCAVPNKVHFMTKIRKRKANSFSCNEPSYSLMPINKNANNPNPFIGYLNKKSSVLNKTVQFRFEIFTNNKGFNNSLTINGMSINK